MTDYMNQYKRNLKALDKSGKGTPVPGEIWWVSNMDGIKARPILVLNCASGTVTYCKCTHFLQTESNLQKESLNCLDF